MNKEQTTNKNLILAVGTRIVTRVEVKNRDGRPICPKGAVGVIIKSPADNYHTYSIRFPDGGDAPLKRNDIMVYSHFRDEEVGEEEVLSDYNLFDNVIYRCVVGSRAYGLEGEDSDVDSRGIYLPPSDLHWSLYGVPEQLENTETDEVYWELQKFLILALKANPNILECLYTPLVEYASPLAKELLDIRGIFLSKLAYQTFQGYVISQFKKMEQDLRNKGEIRWKHAMHLIRLLVSGITLLNEEYLPVKADRHKDKLILIKKGEMEWEEINKLRLALHEEFDLAFTKTSLPERPDYEQANQFLIKARRFRAENN
jgi:uncharacterized protein